jgi:hypothetical protein
MKQQLRCEYPLYSQGEAPKCSNSAWSIIYEDYTHQAYTVCCVHLVEMVGHLCDLFPHLTMWVIRISDGTTFSYRKEPPLSDRGVTPPSPTGTDNDEFAF